MAEHGTLSRYTNGGCRCDDCKAAMSAYQRRRRGEAPDCDREALRDLLAELFPDGLTDDCPARQAQAA